MQDTSPRLPDRLSHNEMSQARDARQAQSLMPAIPWITRYASAWWVEYEYGWLRILDAAASTELNELATRYTTGNSEEGSCPPQH